ncbi:hypothetical protein GALMADRAFT_1161173 [Galerina marginata CBS 339.88]|uniref:Uncharacterized protein n=1 Tax=Galerina marginata (strain CBS 339.88) TaxID=685588 RepID=A0A067SES0_GALM3|nr:hypothetical protein GALMADRAFT_1161173 [Galerina marginata CBS 339.88]
MSPCVPTREGLIKLDILSWEIRVTSDRPRRLRHRVDLFPVQTSPLPRHRENEERFTPAPAQQTGNVASCRRLIYAPQTGQPSALFAFPAKVGDNLKFVAVGN